MMPGKRIRLFALFNIASTVIEEAVLITVLLWLLPPFGIRIPLWLVVVLALVWAAWSYLSYRLGKRAVCKTPAVGPEAMVGIICRTTTPLSPVGYVQADIELWRACSIAGDIDAGVEVVTVGIKGLTLFVTPSIDTNNKAKRCAQAHGQKHQRNSDGYLSLRLLFMLWNLETGYCRLSAGPVGLGLCDTRGSSISAELPHCTQRCW